MNGLVRPPRERQSPKFSLKWRIVLSFLPNKSVQLHRTVQGIDFRVAAMAGMTTGKAGISYLLEELVRAGWNLIPYFVLSPLINYMNNCYFFSS